MNPLLVTLACLCSALAVSACNSREPGSPTTVDAKTDCRSDDKYYDESNVQRCTARLALALSNQDRGMTLNVRGNTYDALKEYDLAIADYSEVIRLLPTFEYAYANRALERCRKKDFSAALPDYDKALLLNPKNSYARYGRGVALSRLGKNAEAATELAAANAIDPEIAAVYREIHMEPSGL